MLDDDIMRQLRALFKVEAAEHIQAMNRDLLALERNPAEKERIALLEEIFREAHSLKGAAGAADIGEVEATAHRLESVFGAAKDGEIELTPDLCDVLYDGIDAVSIVVEAALEDRPHGLDLPDLFARLDAAEEGQITPIAERRPEAASLAIEGRMPPEVEYREQEAMGGELPLLVEPTTPTPTIMPQPRPKPQSPRATPVVEETIRVATGKLDALMAQAGELLVAGLKIGQRLQEVGEISHTIEDWNREWLKIRAEYSHLLQSDGHKELRSLLKFLHLNQQRLKTLTTQTSDLWRGFSRDALHLSRVTTDLGEEVMKVRMLPVSTVFDLLPRMVRDLTREKGKQVDLHIEGGETELDRKVLEEIKDPLIHLLRNCVDHGIEIPEDRLKAGKPPHGTIAMAAFQKGGHIVIKAIDDGAGINVEKVKKKALQANLISPEDMETMSDDEAIQLIFVSGLTTTSVVTATSGRGVGMDVVRKNIESLHGHVDVDSVFGEGTTFTLTLPLTLATTQELLVQVGDQTFGIPISSVERIQRIQQQDIRMVEGKEAILVDSDPVSLVYLASVLELPLQEEKLSSNDKMNKIPVVILRATKRRVAFLVDGVVGQQESVVKSLGTQLSRVRNVAGATILGTGQVIMTLNPTDLIKSARGAGGRRLVTARTSPSAGSGRGQAQEKEMEAEVKRQTILVVDDASTIRNLEKNILEMAGYDVKVATDGVEALSILQSNSCDLIVSDVLMPRMDGFELTTSVRKDPEIGELPIILVTALESQKDKERGLEVGADAYIIKSTFDQTNLLQTIEQLI